MTSPSLDLPPLPLPPPPAATSLPNQTAETPPPTIPSTSAPPPQSPAPPVSSSPPPSLPDASPPPPAPPLPTSPPPLPPSPPPPAPPLPTSPPPLPPSPPPPSPPASTPPPLPPPVNATPPAAPVLPPPPPAAASGGGSPPPQPSPTPPDTPPVNTSPPPPSPPVSDPPPPLPPTPPENEKLPPPPPSNTSPALPSNTSNSPPTPLVPNSSAPRTPPPQTPPSSPNKPTERSTNPSSNGTDTATSGGPAGGSKRGGGGGGAVAIGLVVGFIILGLLVLAMWYRRRQKKRRRHNLGYIMPSPSVSSLNSESLFLRSHKTAHLSTTSPPGSNFMYSPEHGGAASSRACFTYEELSQATNGFSGSNLLGEGGFGCVYKGVLEDGREVAVKQLKIGGGQGEREFRAEVETISRVHHRHLVSLVGYCMHEHQRLLVYQYVPNDTLHYHLHGQGRPVMDWATRIKVAAGAARGLAYLHEDCHPRIIHRDIKSSNILLDNNFDAQVADFGLAKLAMDTDTHVTTRVMGTFGYVAPEYASSGKLTEKSDVFSFGVLLLELITGRKPVDASRPLGDESLVVWARPLLGQALENQQFEELVDPRLGSNYVQEEMFRMIEAAAACIRHLAPKRPRMSQVVRALDSIVEFTTDLTNGMRPGQSQVFDSRDQSAQIRLFQRMAFGSQDYSSEYFNNSHGSWS